MYREGDELVCVVGSTTLKYHARAIDDLIAWLKEQGDWVPVGAADEQKPATDGTVETWGRSESNPVGAGTDCARATEADSGCTCPRYSNSSGSPSSRTTPATTA